VHDPWRQQHARRQIRSDERARVPAPGQFGQVAAIAAADVGDDLMAAQPGQAEYLAGQVYRRPLVRVYGLPGGQVDVGLVLDVPRRKDRSVHTRSAWPGSVIRASLR
jgi:hypothetical protein